MNRYRILSNTCIWCYNNGQVLSCDPFPTHGRPPRLPVLRRASPEGDLRGPPGEGDLDDVALQHAPRRDATFVSVSESLTTSKFRTHFRLVYHFVTVISLQKQGRSGGLGVGPLREERPQCPPTSSPSSCRTFPTSPPPVAKTLSFEVRLPAALLWESFFLKNERAFTVQSA